MGDRIVFSTDNAIVVLYDPKGMKHRVRAARSWWDHAVKDGDYAKIQEVREGKIAIWPLGGKGGRYAARIRVGALTDQERAYDKGSVKGLGVVVESGQVFVGPGERIPGEGFGDRIVSLDDAGSVVPIAPGRYLTTVHVLDWKHEKSFFDDEGEPRQDAPSDFVILLEPTELTAFSPPRPVPQLLELLPKVEPPKKVSTAVIARTVSTVTARSPRVEVGRPAAGRGPRKKKDEEQEWHPAPDPEPPGKPGEIRIGSRVRHAQFGIGNVLFIREGFPKVKVDFRGNEQKVDRSELEWVE